MLKITKIYIKKETFIKIQIKNFYIKRRKGRKIKKIYKITGSKKHIKRNKIQTIYKEDIKKI